MARSIVPRSTFGKVRHGVGINQRPILLVRWYRANKRWVKSLNVLSRVASCFQNTDEKSAYRRARRYIGRNSGLPKFSDRRLSYKFWIAYPRIPLPSTKLFNSRQTYIARANNPRWLPYRNGLRWKSREYTVSRNFQVARSETVRAGENSP